MKLNIRQHLCIHNWSKEIDVIGIPFKYCIKCNAIKRRLYLLDTLLFYNEVVHKLYPNESNNIIEEIKLKQ